MRCGSRLDVSQDEHLLAGAVPRSASLTEDGVAKPSETACAETVEFESRLCWKHRGKAVVL